MWLSGAVGAATALGYYVIAFGVALLALLMLAALRDIAHDVLRGKARARTANGQTGLENPESLRSQMKQGKPPST
jgi:uncharacterized membrane protein YhiD involved in acid resistance